MPVENRWPEQPNQSERLWLRDLWARRKSELLPPLNRWQIWWVDPLTSPVLIDGKEPPGCLELCWSKAWTRGATYFTEFDPRPAIVVSNDRVHKRGRAWVVPLSHQRHGHRGELNTVAAGDSGAARAYWVRSVSHPSGATPADMLRFQENLNAFYQPSLQALTCRLLRGEKADDNCLQRGTVVKHFRDVRAEGLLLGSCRLFEHRNGHPHVLYVAARRSPDEEDVIRVRSRIGKSYRGAVSQANADSLLEERYLAALNDRGLVVAKSGQDDGEMIFDLCHISPMLCVSARSTGRIDAASLQAVDSLAERLLGN